MNIKIDASWQKQLQLEFEKPYFEELRQFVKGEYSTNKCFPESDHIFEAFNL